MFQVYQLRDFGMRGNSHNVDRAEMWEIQKYKEFEFEEDARECVIVENMKHTELPQKLWKYESCKETLIDRFCFTDDAFYCDRRFFLGKPDMEKMETALNSRGITVQK